MTSIPPNLTLIREDFQSSPSLSEIKARMGSVPTDYVMVVGLDDIVEVISPLDQGVHYLPTHVATRRAFRHSRPVVPYDPVLLIQFNCLGMPILHKSLVSLFPETSVEPWHRVMVRAQTQGASFALAQGNHTIVEPWPRPELSGAYDRYRFSIDPEAVMEAVPSIRIHEINQQPFYSLKNPRVESITAFCRNCSDDFVASLAGYNIRIEQVQEFDYNLILASSATYVAWFDSIAESTDSEALSELHTGLEFPGVSVVSPRIIDHFSLAAYHHPAFSMLRGVTPGFNSIAWMARRADLVQTPPSEGYVNNQAILREIP